MCGFSSLVLALGMMVASPAGASRTPQRGSTVEPDNLKEMEREIGRAWVRGDRTRLDRILADDWTVIDIAGRVRTKTEILESMFGPDGSQIARMDIDEVEVRFLGEVAVVTGRTLAVGKDGTTMHLRFTDIAVQKDGEWRVVASQGTPIVP